MQIREIEQNRAIQGEFGPTVAVLTDISIGRSPDLAKTIVKILPCSSAAVLAVCCFLAASPSSALDIGFELSARAAISDNLFQDNTGDEEEGAATLTEMLVYGSHQSQRLVAGFQGELGLRRRLSDDDDRSDSTTITRFFGSAEFALTRSTSWFFGDVLGGTRDNDTLITDDETEEFDNRRNVLVTGPQIKWELDSIRDLQGHLYLIDNSDDAGTDFAQLYELELDYVQQFQAGWLWGLRLENFLVSASDESTEPDFNRTTLGITGDRVRNTNTWRGFLGATRYQAGGDADYETNGATASLRFERTSTDVSSFYVEGSRSIVDQTLNETETLLGTGSAESSDLPGIFNDTILRLGYEFETTNASLSAEFGAGISDFEAIFVGGEIIELEGDAQDQQRLFGSINVFRSITPKLAFTATVGHSQEEFLEGDDFTESSYGTFSLQYQISTSFTLRATYLHEILQGLNSDDLMDDVTDSNENRVFLSLTYAPPTRADKEQVESLKTLLF